jgi:hypothetical protein
MRSNYILFKALFLLVCFLPLAHASDWVEVCRTAKDEPVYIDRSSVRVNGDTATVWQKVANKDGSEYRFHAEFLRAARKSRYLSSVTYDADGNVVKTTSDPSPWIDIIPDSVGEDVYNVVFESTAIGV